MALTIKDAAKKALRARIALLALTGGGKTYTGLRFLNAMKDMGMARKIGVIDTEHGSASKYINAPFPPFRVIEMEDDFSPEQYIQALSMLADDGCDAALVDSLSHAWAGKGGSLELKDKFAKKGFNDYTAWGPVSAMQNRMIEALLSFPGHLIVTMRVKMEHLIEKDAVTGRNAVRKIGLQPVQRDGLEYEFDLVGDLDQDHNFTVSKTRCSALDGYSANKPGEEVIRKLRSWLESGEAVRAPVKPAAPALGVAPAVSAHASTAAESSATASAPSPAQPTGAPETSTSATDPIVALLARVVSAPDQAALDAIVPDVKGLPEATRAVVRARWMDRQKELQGRAA